MPGARDPSPRDTVREEEGMRQGRACGSEYSKFPLISCLVSCILLISGTFLATTSSGETGSDYPQPTVGSPNASSRKPICPPLENQEAYVAISNNNTLRRELGIPPGPRRRSRAARPIPTSYGLASQFGSQYYFGPPQRPYYLYAPGCRYLIGRSAKGRFEGPYIRDGRFWWIYEGCFFLGEMPDGTPVVPKGPLPQYRGPYVLNGKVWYLVGYWWVNQEMSRPILPGISPTELPYEGEFWWDDWYYHIQGHFVRKSATSTWEQIKRGRKAWCLMTPEEQREYSFQWGLFCIAKRTRWCSSWCHKYHSDSRLPKVYTEAHCSPGTPTEHPTVFPKPHEVGTAPLPVP